MEKDMRKDRAWSSFERPRGVRACLADAWRAYALQPGKYVGFLLAPLLAAGAAFAAAGYMAARLWADFVLPLRLLAEAVGGAAPALVWAALPPRAVALAAGAVVVVAAGFFVWSGVAAAQLRFVRLHGRLPGRADAPEAAREALAAGGRALAVGVPVALVEAGLVALAAWLRSCEGVAPVAGAVLVLVLAVLVAVAAPVAFVAHVVERRPLGQSLWLPVSGFVRLMGGFVIIGVLTLAMLVPAVACALLPLATWLLSAHAGAMSYLMGDAAEAVPAAATGIWFAGAVPAAAFVLLGMSLPLWAFAYRLAADAATTGRPRRSPAGRQGDEK